MNKKNAMKERVADRVHAERGKFGCEFLMIVSVKTTPEQRCEYNINRIGNNLTVCYRETLT
jgi:hypothetical protein